MLRSVCLLSVVLTLMITSYAEAANEEVIGPLIVGVEQGSPIELSCKWNTNDSFKSWDYFDSMDNSREFAVYSLGPRLKPNLTSVYVRHESHNFISTVGVTSTKMDDAGKYLCQILADGNRLFSKTAELIVVTRPNCSINDSEQTNVIEMQCSVHFRGSWSPVIKWQDNSGIELIPSYENLTNSSHAAKTFTSVLTLPGNTNCTLSYSCSVLFNGSIPENEEWLQSSVREYDFTRTSMCTIPCKGQANDNNTQIPKVVLIGFVMTIATLVLLTAAVISRRCCIGRKKEDSVITEDDENAEETNGNQPINEIAEYAEIIDIAGDGNQPSTSREPQFFRIEKYGKVRLLAPDGIEYLELNRSDGAKGVASPQSPSSSGAVNLDSPPIIASEYFLANHVPVKHTRNNNTLQYENIEIRKEL